MPVVLRTSMGVQFSPQRPSLSRSRSEPKQVLSRRLLPAWLGESHRRYPEHADGENGRRAGPADSAMRWLNASDQGPNDSQDSIRKLREPPGVPPCRCSAATEETWRRPGRGEARWLAPRRRSGTDRFDEGGAGTGAVSLRNNGCANEKHLPPNIHTRCTAANPTPCESHLRRTAFRAKKCGRRVRFLQKPLPVYMIRIPCIAFASTCSQVSLCLRTIERFRSRGSQFKHFPSRTHAWAPRGRCMAGTSHGSVVLGRRSDDDTTQRFGALIARAVT